jgi:hypothetical protein
VRDKPDKPFRIDEFIVVDGDEIASTAAAVGRGSGRRDPALFEDVTTSTPVR